MSGNSVVRDKTNERHGLLRGIESCDIANYGAPSARRQYFESPVWNGADYELRDREAAFTRIPQALALTIVDLLADGAQKADEICTAFKPRLDRESYVAFMDDIR